MQRTIRKAEERRLTLEKDGKLRHHNKLMEGKKKKKEGDARSSFRFERVRVENDQIIRSFSKKGGKGQPTFS